MNFQRLSWLLSAWLWLAASGPARGALPAQLEQDFGEFLSQVRYLITPEERKAFRALPDSEKPRFIQEFWARRDPDPSTPHNELKDIYFGRIAAADRLFVGEGAPGWMTDRGRVYVLYGPPSERSTTRPTQLSAAARDTASSPRCYEVWSYRGYQVIFVDQKCRGSFSLETVDLGPLYDLSIAKDTAQKPIRPRSEEAPSYDFDIALRQKKTEEVRFEGLVEIAIPYASIWFIVEGGKYVATYEIQLELKDSQNVLRWQYSGKQDLALSPEELRQNQKNKYQIAIPILIEKDVAALRVGKNNLLVALKNTKVNELVRKTAEFTLTSEPEGPEKRS
ncbi:MAG: GWxTD domain-containing protein [Acidobacteriota bacterium]